MRLKKKNAIQELISEKEKIMIDVFFKICARRSGAKIQNGLLKVRKLRGSGASKWNIVLQVIRLYLA